MLTDDHLIEQLRVGLAPLRPRADLIERLREQALTETVRDRPARPQIARRRRPRVSLRVLVLVATGALSVGIVIAALALLHHRATTSALAPDGRPVPTRPAQRNARQSSDLPAPIKAAQVATPLSLRIVGVARYCDAAAGQLAVVRCRPGQKPLSSQPQRLIQLTFIARRATGVNSWYAYDLSAPRACARASNSGPTYSPIRRGARLLFEALLPPDCRGTITATVSYWTQAPRADIERSARVGQRTLRTP